MKYAPLFLGLFSVLGLSACVATTPSTSETQAQANTPQVLYWEVAPQLRPCSHPLIPNYQCLNIRDLAYNSQSGQYTPSGEWSNYYGQIEGYEHKPGHGHIIKVERHTKEHVPADASQYRDVLVELIASQS